MDAGSSRCAPPHRAAITSGTLRIAASGTVIVPLPNPFARYKPHGQCGASGQVQPFYPQCAAGPADTPPLSPHCR